ncbi:MAG: efflux RND transporter periplasmic adaptor subunit [Opitutales bacterium]
MNKQTSITFLGGICIALIVGIFIGRLFFGNDAHDHAVGIESLQASSVPETWTCSMHPSIQQPEMGDCPICGMDLIPLESGSGAGEGPRALSMSEASRALADIQTTEIRRDFPEAEIRLVGKLDYDETRERSLSARFPARIDELYVNFTGIRVQKGEHLAKVYSPDLLTAQRELLSAYRADPNSSITRAAREKLRLWDLLPEQIDAIVESGEAKDHFVLKAPAGGIVTAKHVNEGDYLETGEPLFEIVDLSVLWAYLDAYESDLPWLRFGQEVSFSVESVPGETFKGQIAFLEPLVDSKTRTVRVRVNIPNKQGRLKPGMFVRALVSSRIAENGQVYAPDLAGKWISPMHPEIVKDGPGACDVCGMDLVPAEELGYVPGEASEAPVVVPSSAVLRTGKRAVVYVEMPDSESPSFEGREIVLGLRAGDVFIVKEGLEVGENVVTHGAFKIDSALQIQAKPSMMNPETEQVEGGQSSIVLSEKLADALVAPYLALQKAMANDDFDKSLTHAKEILEIHGHSGELHDALHAMAAAGDLEAMRRPHFDVLSQAMIASLKKTEGLWLMHCPMVYGATGADWIQDSDDLRNPYFGSMMLMCGEVKGKLGE